MSRITRSYFLKVPSELNAGKHRVLTDLHNEWQRVLPKAFNWYWQAFFHRGTFHPHLRSSGPAGSFPSTSLGVAHRDSMHASLAGQAKSWTSNLVNRCRTVIGSTTAIDDSMRHALNWINIMKLWNGHNREQNALLTEQNIAADRKERLRVWKALEEGVDPEDIVVARLQDRLLVITPDATKTLKKWFWNYIHRFKLPNPRNFPLAFNGNNFHIEANRSRKPQEAQLFQHFDGWVDLTTLTMGKRVCVPFQSYELVEGVIDDGLAVHLERSNLKAIEAAERKRLQALNPDMVFEAKKRGRKAKTKADKNADGSMVTNKNVDFKSSIELHRRQGEWYFKFVFEKYAEGWDPDDESRVNILGLDLGLRNFLASSEGDLVGIDFIDTLYRYDRQLMNVQASLQQAGVVRFGQCERYRSLMTRIRGFLKTNIRKWLRQVLMRHRPHKVVVEKLSFMQALDPENGRKGLGKRLNRLVRSFGQRVFNTALDEWSVEFGFEVQEINPAKTSQTCTHCGFAHKRNRNGNMFTCLLCHFRAHSDVQAAKVQSRRSGLDHLVQGKGDGVKEWQVGTMKGWVAQLRVSLQKSATNVPWKQCLVGRARRGLLLLLAGLKGDLAQRTELAQRLKRVLALSDQGLCTTIRRCGAMWEEWILPPSRKLTLSTR